MHFIIDTKSLNCAYIKCKCDLTPDGWMAMKWRHSWKQIWRQYVLIRNVLLDCKYFGDIYS